jgi:hypothetical protein
VARDELTGIYQSAHSGHASSSEFSALAATALTVHPRHISTSATKRSGRWGEEEETEEDLRGRRERYELVVVGGGAGGCSTASFFCKQLGKGRVCVIEPKEVRIYSMHAALAVFAKTIISFHNSKFTKIHA